MAKKLDALPRKESKYWQKADYNVHVLTKPPKCKHTFKHRTAQEVECQNCHIGFMLSPGFKVKSGHIYKGKKLVI